MAMAERKNPSKPNHSTDKRRGIVSAIRECYDDGAFSWKGPPFRSRWTISTPEGST
jgi:hypothetical protein